MQSHLYWIFFFSTLGVDEVDYSLYPKREHQLKFIAVYLEEAAKLRGTVCCDAASSLVQFKIILTFNKIQCRFGVRLWVSKIYIYYHKSSIKPPSLINPLFIISPHLFQRKSVNKPPTPLLLNLPLPPYYSLLINKNVF